MVPSQYTRFPFGFFRRLGQILKPVLGVLCLIYGIVALVTPFTPASWLIFVGLELLGLTFLLPRGVRERWEKLKASLLERMRRR